MQSSKDLNSSTKKNPSAEKATKSPGTSVKDSDSTNDANSGSEINEREPKHLFRGARPANEAEGLPLDDLPRHIGVDPDDENELDEGYVRTGALDKNPEAGEEELEAAESEGLEETGV